MNRWLELLDELCIEDMKMYENCNNGIKCNKKDCKYYKDEQKIKTYYVACIDFEYYEKKETPMV